MFVWPFLFCFVLIFEFWFSRYFSLFWKMDFVSFLFRFCFVFVSFCLVSTENGSGNLWILGNQRLASFKPVAWLHQRFVLLTFIWWECFLFYFHSNFSLDYYYYIYIYFFLESLLNEEHGKLQVIFCFIVRLRNGAATSLGQRLIVVGGSHCGHEGALRSAPFPSPSSFSSSSCFLNFVSVDWDRFAELNDQVVAGAIKMGAEIWFVGVWRRQMEWRPLRDNGIGRRGENKFPAQRKKKLLLLEFVRFVCHLFYLTFFFCFFARSVLFGKWRGGEEVGWGGGGEGVCVAVVAVAVVVVVVVVVVAGSLLIALACWFCWFWRRVSSGGPGAGSPSPPAIRPLAARPQWKRRPGSDSISDEYANISVIYKYIYIYIFCLIFWKLEL